MILNKDLNKLNCDLENLKRTRDEYERDWAVEKSQKQLELVVSSIRDKPGLGKGSKNFLFF